jgi:hypothetical protein
VLINTQDHRLANKLAPTRHLFRLVQRLIQLKATRHWPGVVLILPMPTGSLPGVVSLPKTIVGITVG